MSLSTPVVHSSARVESGVAPVAWKQVIGVKVGQRPLIVWISDETADAVVEHRTFDDASVRLASRAFRTVRITHAAAAADPFLASYVRSGPAMLVLAPDLTRGAATYGPSLDAKSAFAALRASAKAYMGMDLDVAVGRAQTLFAEEQTLAGEKASLPRTTSDYAARAAALDRRLAAIHAEQDAALRPTVPPVR